MCLCIAKEGEGRERERESRGGEGEMQRRSEEIVGVFHFEISIHLLVGEDQ